MSNFNSVEDYMQNAENNRNSAVLKTLLEDEPGMRELPNITDNDIGKYLKVKSDKSLEWAEGGSSGGGVLVVHEDENNGTLDKTAAEIFTALENNTVVIKMEGEDGEGKSYISIQVMVDAHVFGNDYYFGAYLGQRYISYSASSGTDYPTEQH